MASHCHRDPVCLPARTSGCNFRIRSFVGRSAGGHGPCVNSCAIPWCQRGLGVRQR